MLQRESKIVFLGIGCFFSDDADGRRCDMSRGYFEKRLRITVTMKQKFVCSMTRRCCDSLCYVCSSRVKVVFCIFQTKRARALSREHSRIYPSNVPSISRNLGRRRAEADVVPTMTKWLDRFCIGSSRFYLLITDCAIVTRSSSLTSLRYLVKVIIIVMG
jgi:hypothetical protein